MEDNKNVRIFLATSQISTIYAMMISEATRTPGTVDVLFLDGSKRRKSLSAVILKTAGIYNWDLIHDFSILMDEDYDFNPTTTKSLTRKIKAWPLIRLVYNRLLEKHLAGIDRNYREQLKKVLEPYLKENVKISLFLQSRTYLNRPLLQLFPNAEVNYLEHGMGDYYYMADPTTVKGNFYCLFATNYKRLLEKKGIDQGWVKQLPNVSSFTEMAQELIVQLENTLTDYTIPTEKPCVLLLLEALDMYEVKHSFWTEYPDHVFAQLKNPEAYHYLLKPHPMQSEISITATKNHFDSLGYSYTLIDHPGLITASVEVIYQLWADKTEHVFCLISSSAYYLSKLYEGKNTRFWYSTEFMSRHIANAPPEYAKMFGELRVLIEEVMGEKCTAY